tara:strand:+ start:545 stop:910 length:366 start_codon:yes stop_codon:yes gene_type:complete
MTNKSIVNRKQKNIQNIYNEIYKKNILHSNTPYIPTSTTVLNVITDYDTFPYMNWYKGSHLLNEPVIDDREAGFRETKHFTRNAANESAQYTIKPKQTCFENACSGIKPCEDNISFYMNNY